MSDTVTVTVTVTDASQLLIVEQSHTRKSLGMETVSVANGNPMRPIKFITCSSLHPRTSPSRIDGFNLSLVIVVDVVPFERCSRESRSQHTEWQPQVA